MRRFPGDIARRRAITDFIVKDTFGNVNMQERPFDPRRESTSGLNRSRPRGVRKSFVANLGRLGDMYSKCIP